MSPVQNYPEVAVEVAVSILDKQKGLQNICNPLFLLASPRRFERPAPSLGGERTICGEQFPDTGGPLGPTSVRLLHDSNSYNKNNLRWLCMKDRPPRWFIWEWTVVGDNGVWGGIMGYISECYRMFWEEKGMITICVLFESDLNVSTICPTDLHSIWE